MEPPGKRSQCAQHATELLKTYIPSVLADLVVFKYTDLSCHGGSIHRDDPSVCWFYAYSGGEPDSFDRISLKFSYPCRTDCMTAPRPAVFVSAPFYSATLNFSWITNHRHTRVAYEDDTVSILFTADEKCSVIESYRPGTAIINLRGPPVDSLVKIVIEQAELYPIRHDESS